MALFSGVSLLRVLCLVASRARTIPTVALVRETAVASAPVRIRRLEAGGARALATVAVVGHAGVLGGGFHGGGAEADHREAREQGNSYCYRHSQSSLRLACHARDARCGNN